MRGSNSLRLSGILSNCQFDLWGVFQTHGTQNCPSGLRLLIEGHPIRQRGRRSAGRTRDNRYVGRQSQRLCSFTVSFEEQTSLA